MDAKTAWLIIFVAVYWAYCLFGGIKGALRSRTATDYMIAGRGIGLAVFVLAATATSFSGWTFVGHPSLIYRDGFQYAYASFYAIVIPLTGVVFLKRQWLLGRRYGFVTPGEMLAAYFKSDTIPCLTVLVALVFSIPYLAVQLRAAGFLFNVLTHGVLSVEVGMWLLATVVAAYVVTGGLRAVAQVDSAQCVLLAVGVVALGLIAIVHVPDLRAGIAKLTQIGADGKALFGQTTPDGYSSYIAIPGVIQGVGDGTQAQGGPWTGVMIMTYMFAMMGIQAAPAFSMWAFSNKSPAPFPWQQVWASSFGIGLILFVFSAFQGLGGHFLGGDLKFLEAYPELVNNIMGAGLHGRDLMESPGQSETLVFQLIWSVGDALPWLVGLLAVCALAAMQSTGAAYMTTAGSMITRDILRRFVLRKATDRQQKFWGRTCVICIILLALAVAASSADALVLLGGLAVAYGLQMWPALIAVCWWPFLTRQGIIVGLSAGMLAVTLTDSIGHSLLAAVGVELPWGRWPLTVHSAGWGILCNLSLAVVVSAFTQNSQAREHRLRYHGFLRQHAGLPAHKKKWVPVAWSVVLVWFCFAIGPGAVIGNWIFGHPNDATTWWFGIPSIWTWQLLWWALGVFMMWFLAFKMELATVPDAAIEELAEASSYAIGR